MARPVPGRWETGDWGHPRRLSETNGMHGASGYRVRTDAEHATPLAGPTYRARTRYRLAGPRSAGETLPAGTRAGPLSRAGILTLQGGEDVNEVYLSARSSLLIRQPLADSIVGASYRAAEYRVHSQ
jgi:hypothetical protein